MKTIKILLTLAVIIALAWVLSVGALYALYFLLIISLFYKGAMLFLIGAVFSALVAWVALKIFNRRKVYSVEQGLHYEN